MKKFGFLIPVAAAVAALSPSAQAKTSPQAPTTDASNLAQSAAVSPLAGMIQTYEKNGELHELMMQPSDAGVMLSYHRSHSSHSSHRSHYSHRSGY